MMYQIKPTNRQNFFSRNLLKILLIFLSILMLVFIFNFSGFVRSLVPNSLSPLFKFGDFLYGGLTKAPNFFSDKTGLIEENKKLSEEVEKSRSQMIDYESIKYENQKLREELKIKPAGEFISTGVLARSPQIPLDSLFINKGTEDNINNGDFVLAGERVLIGKIAKASKNRATVVLNSFAGAVTYGYVARTEEPIEIKGNGGGGLEAKVPIDFDINIGDKIMVSGASPYLAAIVGIIEEDSSSGFKEIFMSLPAAVSKTNVVFVEPVIKE